MKLIFDIGYNKGFFSKECKRLFPDCKIIGVEANKKLVNKEQEKNNIFILNALVSNQPNEMVDFFIDPSQDGISTASKNYLINSRF